MAAPFGDGMATAVDLASGPDRTSVLLENPPAAWLDVLHERQRQVSGEGWTPEHDDATKGGKIAGAAACYTLQALLDDIPAPDHRQTIMANIRALWPWSFERWKPTTKRRDLVKAGALILAEIERIDRAAQRAEG